MMMIQFAVYGAPVAQPRQRHSLITTKTGAQFIHNYTPKKDPVTQWKSDVKMEAIRAWCERFPSGTPVWSGPIWMIMDFYLPRPQSFCRKKDPEGPMYCIAKPDLDNLTKSVKDALTGVVYVDDKQVCEERIRKVYHEKGGRPRAEITIGQKDYQGKWFLPWRL